MNNQKNYAKLFNEAARKVSRKEKKSSRQERLGTIKKVLKTINPKDL